MQNMIAELTKILPPPAEPLDGDEAGWKQNQRSMRIELPEDYLEFGRVYGSGTIKSAYAWEVWSPNRPSYPQIVLEFARIQNIFKDAMEITDVPFGIFPEEGGLLPFALSGDGDYVCFVTKGEPEAWQVVDIYQYENGNFETLEMGFSEYFYRVLTRDIVLERHKEGNPWNPETDLKFKQRVFADK